MELIVQKYGGTSVGSAERLRAVAQRVAKRRASGHPMVVVVSAMGKTTDELIDLARRVTLEDLTAAPSVLPEREMDLLLSTGEIVSCTLLAMALCSLGVPAMSFTGHQAGIETDTAHGRARILRVDPRRIRAALERGHVAVVAGFQGTTEEIDITTLGRGGSDTTAVALAAALGAAQCEIYTDVDGVYTADPRRVPDARLVRELSHAEMIELASAGARVMHPRAVEIGARWGVDIRVLSSFAEPPAAGVAGGGTLITRTPRRMEGFVLTGIASLRGQAKLVLHRLPPGLAAPTRLLGRLAEAGISVDLVSEARERDGTAQLEITVHEEVLEEARELCARELAELRAGDEIETRAGLSRIALVGSGMHDRPGVYARTFRALLEADVALHAVSSSAISITLLVASECEDAALRALHRAFALELQGVPTTGGDPQAHPPPPPG